jgi:HD-like signal output (HDOD) protein
MVAQDKQLVTTGYPDEFTGAERALLGFTNADTGAALLRRWDFPPAVVEPVRAQYQPVLAASHSRLAHLLLVARWLRSAACDADLPRVLPDARSMAILGFSEATLTETLVVVRRRLEEANKLLNIN